MQSNIDSRPTPPGNGAKTLERPAKIKIPPLREEEIVTTRPELVIITAPKFQTAIVKIRGAEGSAYVQHAFSEKARKIMEERMAEGTKGRNTRRTKAPRNFDDEYLRSQHIMRDGTHGIPAPAFRNAMITACSLVGYAMTRAKLTIFVSPADGIDRESGMPLVRIYGKPRIFEAPVRFQGQTSSIWRPMWEEWTAIVRLKWDADQFSASDVGNLMARAGLQVGIGEGRPASKNSAGLGWGLFDVQGLTDGVSGIEDDELSSDATTSSVVSPSKRASRAKRLVDVGGNRR